MELRLFPFAVSLVVIAGLVTTLATAQERTPTDDDTTARSPAGNDEPEQPSKPNPPKGKGDDELLKDLVGDLPLGSDDADDPNDPNQPDELDQAVSSMRQASDRIGKGDTSDELQQVQRSALKSIDALIERLKNQPPPQSSQNNQQQNENQSENEQQQNDNSQSRSPQRNQRPQAGSQSKPESGTGAGQQQQKPAAESTERNQGQARKRATDLARRRALINEIWGHLPPSYREKLLNVGREKLLPQYEELINRYYEALAEAADSRPNR